ncbi:unnamed protein product, partial [Ectocarpus sp. 12 AP-2014]
VNGAIIRQGEDLPLHGRVKSLARPALHATSTAGGTRDELGIMHERYLVAMRTTFLQLHWFVCVCIVHPCSSERGQADCWLGGTVKTNVTKQRSKTIFRFQVLEADDSQLLYSKVKQN